MNRPKTPTAQHLFTTNKDRMPRNLTVRESEILDIESELLIELEKEGWVMVSNHLYEALLQWYRVMSTTNTGVLVKEIKMHLEGEDA